MITEFKDKMIRQVDAKTKLFIKILHSKKKKKNKKNNYGINNHSQL